MSIAVVRHPSLLFPLSKLQGILWTKSNRLKSASASTAVQSTNPLEYYLFRDLTVVCAHTDLHAV